MHGANTLLRKYIYICSKDFFSLSRPVSLSLSLYDTFTQFCWVKIFYLFVFDPDLKNSAFLESDLCVSNILVGLWCYWLLYHYFKIKFRFVSCFSFDHRRGFTYLHGPFVCCFFSVSFIVLIRILFFLFVQRFIYGWRYTLYKCDLQLSSKTSVTLCVYRLVS